MADERVFVKPTWPVQATEIMLNLHTHDGGTWLEHEDWKWRVEAKLADGTWAVLFETLSNVAQGDEKDEALERRRHRYQKYAESMVEQGFSVLPETGAQDIPEWACACCGKKFFGTARGPLYFTMCWQHPHMRVPTMDEAQYARQFGAWHGPHTPPAVELVKYARDTISGLTFFRWDGDAQDLADDLTLSGSYLVKQEADQVEFTGAWFVELPYSTWGEYAGDDITRHNYEYWAKTYEGQDFWRKASWFRSQSIVIRLLDLTQEVYDLVMGLVVNYCSLDDDGLYETQQKLQEAAWDGYVRYEWPDALRAALKDLIGQVGADREIGAQYEAKLEEALDEDKGQQLFWDCVSRADDTGDIWVYEDGESATLREMDKAAGALKLTDLIPRDEKTLALPGMEEAHD